MFVEDVPEKLLTVLEQVGYREIMAVIEQFESVSIDKSSAEAVLGRALPFCPVPGQRVSDLFANYHR